MVITSNQWPVPSHVGTIMFIDKILIFAQCSTIITVLMRATRCCCSHKSSEQLSWTFVSSSYNYNTASAPPQSAHWPFGCDLTPANETPLNCAQNCVCRHRQMGLFLNFKIMKLIINTKKANGHILTYLLCGSLYPQLTIWLD